MLEHVAQRVLQADLRAPNPWRRGSLEGSPRTTGTSTGRARAGSSSRLQLDPRQFLEALGDLGDGDVAPAAHVVDLAGDAALGQQPVGAHHVADVGESRRGERFPTTMLVAPLRRASTIRSASADTTNAEDCPGPTWLNGRTRSTGKP